MAWRGRRCDNLANIKLSQKEHTMTHLEKERERKRNQSSNFNFNKILVLKEKNNSTKRKRKNILGLHSNLRRNIWKYKRELES